MTEYRGFEIHEGNGFFRAYGEIEYFGDIEETSFDADTLEELCDLIDEEF